MTDKPDSDEIEKMAFASGWEREHGVDHADYLDAVADGTYPANAVATDPVVAPDADNDEPESGRTFLGFIPKDAPDAVIASYLQKAAGLVAGFDGEQPALRAALSELWEKHFGGDQQIE